MTIVRTLHAIWALCLAGLLLCMNNALALDANCRSADEEMARLDRTLRDALTTAVPGERGRLVRTAEGTVQRIERLPVCAIPIEPGLGVTTTYRHGEIARLKFQAISALIKTLPATGARPTLRQLSGMGSALGELDGFLSMGGGDTGAIEAMRDNLVERIEGVRVRPAGLAPTGSILPSQEILIAQEIAADDKGLVFSQFVLNPHAKRAGWRRVVAKPIGSNWRPEGYAVGIEIAIPDPAGLVDRHRSTLAKWLARGAALRLGRSEKMTPVHHAARGALLGESPCAGIWLLDTGGAPALRLYDLRHSELIAQWSLGEGQLDPALAGVVWRILARMPTNQQSISSPAKAFGKRLSLPLVPFLKNAEDLSRLPGKGNIGLVLRYRNPDCVSPGIVSLPHCSALQLECAARPGLEAYLVTNGRRTGHWNATDWYGNKGAFNQDMDAIRRLATGQSVPPSSQITTVAPQEIPAPVREIVTPPGAIAPVEDRVIPPEGAFPVPAAPSVPGVAPRAREEPLTPEWESPLPPKQYRLTVHATPNNARIRNMTIKPEYQPGKKIKEGEHEIEVSAPGFVTQQRWIMLDKDTEISVVLEPIPEDPQKTREEGKAPPSLSRAQESAPPTAAAGKLTPELDSVGNTGNTRRSRTILQDTLGDGAYGPGMIVIPAGSFQMGSPGSEFGHTSSEAPQHLVHIAEPFALGVTEVTFADYDRFATATGRELPGDNGWGRGKRPVVNVSWWEATAYTAWLSEQTGWNYRLPSEAEWEYAARAGTATPFFTGRCIDTDTANHDGNYAYAGCAKTGMRREKTVPTGSLPANPWGLYEMHGNVDEWTADCLHGSYQGAPADGRAWGKKNAGNCFYHMIRGGSWKTPPSLLRSASRYHMQEATKQNDLGFRVAKSLK
uniref:Formylglycine-generating enzyme, required for sulfatase activity, contains SUMF1/FGE domain n=1 Tax=Candidatus Kentrum sp. DK TaxID=2126562 RepID=A0A450S055_9GAMM|nr:MAG: Formylglycine-generating enzyme, required for sulfatase activity, contains SUMF1/FGE domain [Candidatus Kentron sp. DK]